MLFYSYKRRIRQRRTKLIDGNLYFLHGKSNLCGVTIGFSGNKTFTVKKHVCNENGRILILETLIDDSEFILVNFYNAYTESEQIQIQTFNEPNMLLSNLYFSSGKHIIFAGDFNLFFNLLIAPKMQRLTLLV